MSDYRERIQARIQAQEIKSAERRAREADEQAHQAAIEAQRQAEKRERDRRDAELTRQVMRLGAEVTALLIEQNVPPQPIWARKPDRKRQDVSTHGIPGGETIPQIRGHFQTGIGWHVYTESSGGKPEAPHRKALYGLRDNGEIFTFMQTSALLDHPNPYHNKSKTEITGLIYPTYLMGEAAMKAVESNEDGLSFFDEGVASLLRNAGPAHFHKPDKDKNTEEKDDGEKPKHIHVNP